MSFYLRRLATLLAAGLLLFSGVSMITPELIGQTDVDLIVTDISVSPQNPIDGDSIVISATVLNIGPSVVSTSFVVNFRIDIHFFANVNVPSPLPGDSSSTVSVSTIMLGGYDSIAVTADYFNEIDESDEGNNVLTLPLMIVGLPDLAISSFDALPSAPSEGNLVDFTVTATNLGSSTLREFAIVVVLDCPSLSACPPESFIAFRIIRGIVAASSEQLHGTWKATLGNHSLSALAIFDVAEEFELIFPENNFATITFPPIVPDAEPPETFIVSAEDGNLNPVDNGGATLSDTISFILSGADNAAVIGFECSLDNSPFLACTSPATYAGLSLGTHSLHVRAIDSSGNTDPSPAVFNWAVESPPDTSIINVFPPALHDGGTTHSRFIRFVFRGTDNLGVQGFECSLDGAAFTTCSNPVVYVVARGVHVFQVKAIDTAGFSDPTPASFRWTVS